MKIEFDHTKREKTLVERGLDFAHADEVFDGLDTARRGAPHHQHEKSK